MNESGGFFDAIKVSSSGMSAERTRMNVIAKNLANMNTTRTPEGGPYRRQQVVFSEVLGSAMNSEDTGRGVVVASIGEDNSEPIKKYDPNHPDAIDGYVYYPNINPVTEMVDMISASRAYEANIQALVSARNMIYKALDIAR